MRDILTLLAFLFPLLAYSVVGCTQINDTGVIGAAVGSSEDCDPVWVCSAWGECLPNGTMYRNCIDQNQCGDGDGRPVEARNCQTGPETGVRTFVIGPPARDGDQYCDASEQGCYSCCAIASSYTSSQRWTCQDWFGCSDVSLHCRNSCEAMDGLST